MAVAPSAPGTAPDAADPSMEEILASIRRILNEDDPAPDAPEPAAEAEPPGSEDVLVLDDSMMVRPPDAAAPAAPAPPSPPPPSPPPPSPPPPPPAPPPPARAQELPMPPPADDENEELVAPAAAAAAASSLGSLMRTLSASKAPAVWAGGPTLEDMVRGELRILLKDWLDTNLPPMVERLVRAEIEKVVGRAVP